MNWFRPLFTLLGLIIVAAIGWYYYGLLDDDAVQKDSVQQQRTIDRPDHSGSGGSEGDGLSVQATPEKLRFPRNALKGEVVLRFRDREEYLAYLAALADAGLEARGRIDRLLSVRVGTDVFDSIDSSRYRADTEFSYEIQRPPVPIEIAPEALSSLRAFGESARFIVGGAVDGGDGTGILVGILDSGLGRHSQFDNTEITQMDLTTDGVSGPGAEHGTSVASIISGSEGIAPGAELFVVRVLNQEGAGSSYDVARGIVEAVDQGVDILNLSLGVYEDSQILRDAVSYAKQQNVILVAAAGNDAFNQLPYPAAYSGVLSVTAVDATGRQALFPNQSDLIDFAAPGVGVLTANNDEGTTLFSGTSAAAPFVTGTLAAMLSADPNRTSQQAVDVLQGQLNDAGSAGVDAVYGAGVVDWERLNERDRPNVLDVALAGIHLQADAIPGTMMPIEVTVQNRGTTRLNTADLEILVGENDPVSFTVGGLSSGEVTSRKIFTQVPSLSTDESLQIVARVLSEQLNDDVRLDNNVKAVGYRPKGK